MMANTQSKHDNLEYASELKASLIKEVEKKIADITPLIRYHASEMNDQLYGFAEPFLRVWKTEAEKSLVMMMAISAWNRGLLPAAEDHAILNHLLNLMSPRLGKKRVDKKKIKTQWLSLTQTRMDRYGLHQELILDCSFNIEGGEVRDLGVVSVKIPFDWSPEEVFMLALYYEDLQDAAGECAGSRTIM